MKLTKHGALSKHFGYTSFRPAQETLIDTILSGRDVLGVLPTGAGKSICFQIPALMMSGAAIVISPLISLMKDQVAALQKSNVPAAYINSSLSATQYQQVLRRVKDGLYKIIYVAPERLSSPSFLEFAENHDFSLLAVDEAHCVSQWGQDFRPDYLNIKDFVSKLRIRPVVAAFTATATAVVRKDIIKLLDLKDTFCLTTGFDRSNLYFGVEKPKNKSKRFYELIHERQDVCGVVYCVTRKAVDSVHAELIRLSIPAAKYHAGMDSADRQINQDEFINGSKSVIVATNAFGMGIDKPDVRYVIHYNMPKNLENYYQEAGRAGRDGKLSECILLFADSDIKIAENMVFSSDNSALTERQKNKVRRQDEARLSRMIRYCEIRSCLRSYILGYFGENMKNNCGNCSNCNRPKLFDFLRR